MSSSIWAVEGWGGGCVLRDGGFGGVGEGKEKMRGEEEEGRKADSFHLTRCGVQRRFMKACVSSSVKTHLLTFCFLFGFFSSSPPQLSQPAFPLLCEEGVISGSIQAGNIPVAWEILFISLLLLLSQSLSSFVQEMNLERKTVAECK